ncbi:hypothetical protein ACYULU_08205 [Breznakiellaceae bacterium SP9]
MLVTAGSFINPEKRKLTLEEFEAWNRELILKSRAGNSITFTEEEFDLFTKYSDKYSKKHKKVSDIV